MLIPSYIIIVPFPPRSTTFIPRISELSFGQLQWSITIRLISKKHMTMDTLSSTKANEWLYLLFSPHYRDFYGKQAIISWWHGNGGLIDYTNEHAVEWWHKQMNNVTCIDSVYCPTWTRFIFIRHSLLILMVGSVMVPIPISLSL